MNKKLLNIIGIALIGLMSLLNSGCGSSAPTVTPCSTTGTLFQAIYTNLTSTTGITNTNTMDSYVHGYEFNVTSNKVICSIGYQSQAAVAGQLYKIELIDNTTGTTLYNTSSTFSSSATSYVSVPNITVQAGHNYIVRRTLLNDLGSVMNRIGRLATSSTYFISFPYSSGVLHITGARFDSNTTSATLSNIGLPYIDIVFQ